MQIGVLLEGALMGEASIEDISYTIRADFLAGLLVDDLALGALVIFQVSLEGEFTVEDDLLRCSLEAQTQVV